MNGNFYNQQNPLNTLFGMVFQGMTPNQIMQTMIAQNPQVQIILNQAQSSGLTPQQFVMQYAKQNNINIQPLLNIFNSK